MSEYEIEPIRGLPGVLPAGETIVWQGAPRFGALARRALHAPLVAGYFAVLLGWGALTAVADHEASARAVVGLGLTAGVGLVAVGLLTLYAWLSAKTTVYTITSRRVVLRFGVALPKCINLPFAQVASAGLQVRADGTGDLPLALVPGARVGYLALWPHVRPWRVGSPEPMLRGVAEPQAVARLLAGALAGAVQGQRHAIETIEPAPVFAPAAQVAA